MPNRHTTTPGPSWILPHHQSESSVRVLSQSPQSESSVGFLSQIPQSESSFRVFSWSPQLESSVRNCIGPEVLMKVCFPCDFHEFSMRFILDCHYNSMRLSWIWYEIVIAITTRLPYSEKYWARRFKELSELILSGWTSGFSTRFAWICPNLP